jgi:hypothetical protein
MAASMKIRAFWGIAQCTLVGVDRRFRGVYCLIALMMEAVNTSETSVYSNDTTRRYIPEGSDLNSREYRVEMRSAQVCFFQQNIAE